MLCNYYEDNFSLIIAGENMKKRCVLFAAKIAKPAAKKEWSFFYFGKINATYMKWQFIKFS